MNPLDPDSLHRTAKLLVETRVVDTLSEALELLQTLRIQIHVSADAACTAAGQAACLTAVNTAHRAFLGGCTVVLDDDPVCVVPWAAGQALSDAVEGCGGTLSTEIDPLVPTVGVGDVALTGESTVWATWAGWVAAAVDDPALRLDETEGIAIAGVAAGALAVSEVFQTQTRTALAAQRAVGVSLWRPDLRYDSPEAVGPPLQYLPTRLWLLGLGHLGQATAWNLGMLPYPAPEDIELVLMDSDAVVEANLGTSLLARADDIGMAKTRMTATRLDSIGIGARIIERRFAADLRVAPGEPAVAIAGFDNADARSALGGAGFQRVVDVGLGRGAAYNDILVHTFPGPTSPADAFRARPAPPVDLSRYEKTIDEIVDEGLADATTARCGMVAIAGTTASASFVGAVAGALAVADLLRSLHSGREVDVIDVDLRSALTSTAASAAGRLRRAIAYTTAGETNR